MKKFVVFMAVVGVAIYSFITMGFSDGSKVLNEIDGTGAKGGGGCSCHSPSAESDINLEIELDSADVPVNHYIPGQRYTVKIMGRNNTNITFPKFGFRATAVTANGSGTENAVNLGEFVSKELPQNCQISTFGNFKVVDHTAAMTATTGNGYYSTKYEVSLPWIAPAAGSGAVSVYAVLLACNNDSKASGDKWNKAALKVDEFLPPLEISGNPSVCVGAVTQLKANKKGISWASSDPTIATVNNFGTVTGKKPGNATVSCTIGDEEYPVIVTVTALPMEGEIIGPDIVCTHNTIRLTNTVEGGTWSCNSKGKFCTVTDSGDVTGMYEGKEQIMYRVVNACGYKLQTKNIVVLKGADPGVIVPDITSMCVGDSIQLRNYVPNGQWHLSNTTGIIGGSGLLLGLKRGTDTVSYTVTEGKCNSVSHKVITFNEKPYIGHISCRRELRVGEKAVISNAMQGGVWTVSNGNALINNNTLIGKSEGDVTVTYTIRDGNCESVETANVNIIEK